MNAKELKDLLVEHDRWLDDPTTGRQLELSNTTFENQDLRGCRFRNVKFNDVHFDRVNAFDVWFLRCEFDNMLFSNSILDRSDFADSHFSNVTFENCLGKETSLGYSTGSKIHLSGNFERAYFTKAFWQDVTAPRLSCPGSNFRRMTLDNADLAGIDLRDATLDGITFTDVDMRNASLQGGSWFRAKLKHVRLGGAQGRAGSGIELARGEAIDFSPNGDGSQLGGTDELRRALESGGFDASVLR